MDHTTNSLRVSTSSTPNQLLIFPVIIRAFTASHKASNITSLQNVIVAIQPILELCTSSVMPRVKGVCVGIESLPVLFSQGP